MHRTIIRQFSHQTIRSMFKKVYPTRPSMAHRVPEGATVVAAEPTQEYVSRTTGRERRWLTLRLREGMLFQHPAR